MTDVFATLVRRSQAAAVLSPALGSAFERPLAEPIWGEHEEVRVARPATPIESSVEQRSSPPAAQPPEVGTARPGTVTHHVVETRLRPSEPPAHDDSHREAAPVPPPLDVAAIIAAALRERPRLTRETVVIRQTVAEASAESAERGQANDIRAGDRPLVVIAAPPALPAPATESRPQPNPAPSIEVRIGRIEVTAAAPKAPAAQPVMPRTPMSRTLTLRDYLARRGRR